MHLAKQIQKEHYLLFLRQEIILFVSYRPGICVVKKGRYTKMSKQIPKFKNEDEEREFWATHDSTEYITWNQAKKVTFSNLKPSVKKISLRLPETMLAELKLLANKRDVPYQSLLKIFLAERIEKELEAR